jgi:beta-N-acetylhexosaminidase
MTTSTQAFYTRETFTSVWAELPPERKAGYFLWPSLSGPEITTEEEELLRKYQPTGVILFRRNLISLAQAKRLCDKLHAIANEAERPFPLLIAIDEEGGRVWRLPPPYHRGTPALELADKEDEDAICSQVIHQAAVATSIGIRVLLAPVADILTEPSNPVMGDRCWGRTPEIVTRNALRVWESLDSMGALGSAKHFPGHGNTTTDSHKGFARSDVSLETLRNREWVPFSALINAKIPIVMTAHVLVPALDAERPATLSPTVLKKYLREEMNFKGVIMSDDLRMNAIAEHYKVKRAQDSSISDNIASTQADPNADAFLKTASMDALNAGCDILLSCQSIIKEDIIFTHLGENLKQNSTFAIEAEEKAWRTVQWFS